MPGHFIPKLIPRQSLFAFHDDIAVGGIDEQFAVLSIVSRKNQIKIANQGARTLPHELQLQELTSPSSSTLCLTVYVTAPQWQLP